MEKQGKYQDSTAFLNRLGAHPFVPEGKSRWEFGIGKNILEKANGDSKKRTNPHKYQAVFYP
jgi:hypothetical protein